MRHAKRAPPLLAVLVVVALLLTGLTLAQLSDVRVTQNILAIGQDAEGNKAILLSLEEPSFAKQAEETTWLLESQSRELTSASVTGLVPGQYIYKDPVITNMGGTAFYLRVKLDAEDALLEALQTSFGLALNPGFVKAADGFYYYTDDEGSPVQMQPRDSVFFFRVTPGSGGNYSMRVPTAWTADDIAGFVTSHGDAAKVVGFGVVAEAVQCTAFDGAIPWQGVTPLAVDASGRTQPQSP